MPDPTCEQREQSRHELREQVRAIRAECLALQRLLPREESWKGPASAVFRLRVASLRARIEAARIALELAEAEL